MTKLFKLAAAAAIAAPLALAGTAAHAQSAADADVSVSILAPVAVQVVGDTTLDFGTVANNTGGTVAIDPATGLRTCSAGLACAGTFTADTLAYSITGTQNASVGVTITPSGFPTGLTFTPVTTLPAGNTVTLGATGFDFNLAGNLAIAASLGAGTHTGDVRVEVAYN